MSVCLSVCVLERWVLLRCAGLCCVAAVAVPKLGSPGFPASAALFGSGDCLEEEEDLGIYQGGIPSVLCPPWTTLFLAACAALITHRGKACILFPSPCTVALTTCRLTRSFQHPPLPPASSPGTPTRKASLAASIITITITIITGGIITSITSITSNPCRRTGISHRWHPLPLLPLHPLPPPGTASASKASPQSWGAAPLDFAPTPPAWGPAPLQERLGITAGRRCPRWRRKREPPRGRVTAQVRGPGAGGRGSPGWTSPQVAPKFLCCRALSERI